MKESEQTELAIIPTKDGRFVAGWIMLGSVAACLGLALVILLHATYEAAGAKEDGVYRPTGYYNRVQTMLGDGSLRHLRAEALRPGQRQPGNTWGRIELDESKAKNRDRVFYEQSRRLRLDIGNFNDGGPGGLFLVRDGKLAISKWAHNFLLPYPEQPKFDGRFAFRGEEMPTMASKNLVLAFIEDKDQRERNSAKEIEVLSARDWLNPTKQRTFRARQYDFMHPSGSGRALGLIVSGDHVRLETPEGLGLIEVTLNGVSLNRSDHNEVERESFEKIVNRQEKRIPNTFQLELGDRLLVRLRGQETVFRFGKLAGGVISRKWLENGREISEVDAAIAREIPYISQLHYAANRYVATHPDPASVKSADVRLTLDRGLNRVLQTELERFIEVFDTRYSSVKEIEKQPAAIAVMDALSGDVLALPSYPSAQKMEQLRELEVAGKISRFSNSQRIRLARNQNLLGIPIGSTTKPLFAISIWDEYPKLRGLVVDEPANQMEKFSGYTLVAPVATVPGARRLNAWQFLQKSSNAYAISLYMATLATPDSWRLDGNGMLVAKNSARGVDYSDSLRGNTIPGGLSRLNHPGNEKFSELFGVQLFKDTTDNDVERLEVDLLATMFEDMGVEDGVVPRAFRDVLSEEANLALQTVDTVRGDMVAMLLGSGTNFWSNVKLAEAYARVGTGREIKMRMTVSAKEKKAPQAERLDVDSKVLGLVHKGMEAATEVGGTAVRIRDVKRRQVAQFKPHGLDFRMIAKTGTARRIAGRECAAFAFYVEVLPEGKSAPLAALSTTVYLQDRAAVRSGAYGRNSAVAVELSKALLPHLAGWLEEHPAVVEWKGK